MCRASGTDQLRMLHNAKKSSPFAFVSPGLWELVFTHLLPVMGCIAGGGRWAWFSSAQALLLPLHPGDPAAAELSGQGVRQRWPCFLLTSFTAFQLFFVCWHRVAVLGLSCLEESEVLAASPAQVPRLSAARSRAWEGTSSHPFKPALDALRKVYFLTSEHPSPYHQNKDVSNPCFQLLRC